MSAAKIHRFRRPGQCCGLCLHMRPTGKPKRWDAYVCAAILGPSWRPGNMPVTPDAGTYCPYFRQKPTRGPRTP